MAEAFFHLQLQGVVVGIVTVVEKTHAPEIGFDASLLDVRLRGQKLPVRSVPGNVNRRIQLDERERITRKVHHVIAKVSNPDHPVIPNFVFDIEIPSESSR